ncbi:Dps family protein [Flavobacterium sp.]|uniref:Dps family protein n=1 Tax=Flavobacterium sp. TaxID=239 RepID=UPI00374DF934
MKTNILGLPVKESELLVKELNILLSNFQVYYQNLRGIHWNIRGKRFFDLHIKFEELYNDLLLKVDEVAERILTLGHTPNHKYSDYKKTSEIAESSQVSNGIKAVEDILHSFKVTISIQRQLLDLSAEAGDEGTNALMSDYIRAQEKLVWMYSAFLNK